MPLTSEDRQPRDVDMTQALAMLADLRLLLVEVDSTPAHYESGNNKEKMRRSADASRQLLYAGHMADLVRAEILNQYHRWRGQTPPEIHA